MTQERKVPQVPPGFRTNVLYQLHYSIQEVLPQFYSLVTNPSGDFAGMSIKVRADGVLVVLRRIGDDGGPLVGFASGYDTLAAIIQMERGIAADFWRPDKPWNGSGGS